MARVAARVALGIGACALLIACLAAEASPERRAVVDAAGRRVELPARPARVFAAGPPASVAVYVVAPEMLLGWTRPLGADAKALLPEAAAALPVLGQLTGRAATASLEAVIAARPDLIVDVGEVDAGYASLADRMQSQAGIPYLLLDGSLERSGETLRQLGDWLGRPDRGRALAAECDAILADLRARLAPIPADRRPRVYQARGASGLETSLPGSIGAELLDLLGARRIVEDGQGGAIASVSMEQVLAWDPEVILTLDRSFFERVWRESAWRETQAVKRGRVHLSPLLPFGWLDAPPSVNRLLGARWAAGLLYPDRFPEDLRPVTRAFYRTFYGIELGDDQLGRLLAPAAVAR